MEAVPIPGRMKGWHAAIHWKTPLDMMSFSLLPYIEPRTLKPQAYYALPAVRAYCESRGIKRVDDETVHTSPQTVHLHPVQPEKREQVFELLKRIEESFHTSVLPASLLRDPFAFFNGSSSKLSPRNVVAAIFKGAR